MGGRHRNIRIHKCNCARLPHADMHGWHGNPNELHWNWLRGVLKYHTCDPWEVSLVSLHMCNCMEYGFGIKVIWLSLNIDFQKIFTNFTKICYFGQEQRVISDEFNSLRPPPDPHPSILSHDEQIWGKCRPRVACMPTRAWMWACNHEITRAAKMDSKVYIQFNNKINETVNHALYKFPVHVHIRGRMYIRLEGRDNVALPEFRRRECHVTVRLSPDSTCLLFDGSGPNNDHSIRQGPERPMATLRIFPVLIQNNRWLALVVIYGRRTVINSSLGVDIYTRHDVSLAMSESCQSHVRVLCRGSVGFTCSQCSTLIWNNSVLSRIIHHRKILRICPIYCQLLYL